jgi:uncharacterized membrane protein
MLLTLVVHIAAGALGLVSGYVALYAVKGARLHRRSGMLFVYAMLTMAVVGMALAVLRDAGPRINIPAGLLTGYLVVTALTTVRPATAASRRVDRVAMLVALGVGLTDIGFGVSALASGRRVGILAIPYFLFGTVALLASAGDLRTVRAGGRTGSARLARHLWRMSFALWIAAMSFFVGQAKVIPAPLRIPRLLPLPGLVVLATMLFWLWRVRGRRVVRGVLAPRATSPRPLREQREAVGERAESRVGA